jgi:hypothetical protein
MELSSHKTMKLSAIRRRLIALLASERKKSQSRQGGTIGFFSKRANTARKRHRQAAVFCGTFLQSKKYQTSTSPTFSQIKIRLTALPAEA